MADSRDAREFYWYDPPMRGQLSITNLHVPKRLRRSIMKFPYDIKVDHDFEAVIDMCGKAADDRPQTWINDQIRNVFVSLHRAGYTHNIAVYERQTGVLVGGLYGLSLGAAFMGESMFSRANDASKIALVHLCARLWANEYEILDTQFINDHLKQFGVYEIPKEEYKARLINVLDKRCDFVRNPFESEEALVKHYLNKLFGNNNISC